jgi:hypothetical protein
MKFTATEYGKKRILSDEFAEATLAMARSMYPKGYSEMDLLAMVGTEVIRTILMQSETDTVELDLESEEFHNFLVAEKDLLRAGVQKVVAFAREQTEGFRAFTKNPRGNA